MAEGQLEWVFDSLVEFLRGPIWNIPVLTFIEQKSVVFEPGAENEEELKKIHEAYKNLVDFMLGSYMEDLRITPDEFERSCSVASKKALNQFHQSLFQQVWAADDFEIFKRMMTQKNLELQLQALEFLTQKRGSVPDCMEPAGKVKDERDMDEIIKKVIEETDSETKKLSPADTALQEKMKQEAQKEKELLEEAIKQVVKVHIPEDAPSELLSEQEATDNNETVQTVNDNDDALDDENKNDDEILDGTENEEKEDDNDDGGSKDIEDDTDENEVEKEDNNENAECDGKEDDIDEEVSNEKNIESSSDVCESLVENSLEADEQDNNFIEQTEHSSTANGITKRSVSEFTIATEPILCTIVPKSSEARPRSEGDNDVYTTTQSQEVTPQELEKRQNYLRQQRDRILAMKKQERARRLSTSDEVITQSRPKSARAARKILREESTEIDPQTLAFRKSLAAKLRDEVIDKAD